MPTRFIEIRNNLTIYSHLPGLRIISKLLKFGTFYNTDGLINCLPQPGQIRNHTKSLCSQLQLTYIILCTLTNPATETKSMGLRADAQLAAFFARRL